MGEIKQHLKKSKKLSTDKYGKMIGTLKQRRADKSISNTGYAKFHDIDPHLVHEGPVHSGGPSVLPSASLATYTTAVRVHTSKDYFIHGDTIYQFTDRSGGTVRALGK